ncbi:hypothetical protein DT73_03020 [Mangrovibacter sp. MFB070]|nr:hypothetical protein DT73_03020 [Mangrovibacter sp. MFB070]
MPLTGSGLAQVDGFGGNVLYTIGYQELSKTVARTYRYPTQDKTCRFLVKIGFFPDQVSTHREYKKMVEPLTLPGLSQ